MGLPGIAWKVGGVEKKKKEKETKKEKEKKSV